MRFVHGEKERLNVKWGGGVIRLEDCWITRWSENGRGYLWTAACQRIQFSISLQCCTMIWDSAPSSILIVPLSPLTPPSWYIWPSVIPFSFFLLVVLHSILFCPSHLYSSPQLLFWSFYSPCPPFSSLHWNNSPLPPSHGHHLPTAQLRLPASGAVTEYARIIFNHLLALCFLRYLIILMLNWIWFQLCDCCWLS